MKICIIPPDQRSAHPDHIMSGQEKVARDHASILTKAGFHVDYWTVNTPHDLSSLGFTHRVMSEVQPRAYFNSSRPNPQTSLKKEWCKRHYLDYDLFLCHTDSSVFLKELVRLGVGHKILSFIHAPFAGTMWGIGFNSGQGRAKWGGGTIASVSERCKNHWNKWSASTKKRLESPDPGYISRPDLLNSSVVHDDFVTEVLCPQYSVITDAVQPATIGPVVLSRIAPEKKIHNAFGLGVQFICRSDNRTYLEKIKTKLDKELVHLDLPHAECMSLLSSAQVLISTWADETSGINAFEAAERGVPVILCENGAPHASRDFLPDWAYITCDDTAKGVKQALNEIPVEWSTMDFRQRLASHMRQNFSLETYSEKVISLVAKITDRTMDMPVAPREFGGDLVAPIGSPEKTRRRKTAEKTAQPPCKTEETAKIKLPPKPKVEKAKKDSVKGGGWQVKSEWIGKGIKVKCKSPYDGSFWECDHDALVERINTSLKAKGKPGIGEPGPSAKQYGASTGLREIDLWRRV